MIGEYQAGSSWLHRLPAGAKLLALGVAIVVMTVLVDTPSRLVAAAAGVLAVAGAAGLSPWALMAQLRQVSWVVGVIFVLQVVLTDWQRALVVCGVLLLSVCLAVTVTLTTRTADMLAAATAAMGPLARFGFPVRQVAIALALTVRSIPLLVEIIGQVDEARRARGLRISPRTVFAPVIVTALRTADGFGEALIARGLD